MPHVIIGAVVGAGLVFLIICLISDVRRCCNRCTAPMSQALLPQPEPELEPRLE